MNFSIINRNTTRITYEEARKRFEEYHPDIILLENGYMGWRKPACFFDRIINKPFSGCRPKDVLRFKSVHPDRRKEKQKKSYRKTLEKRPKKEIKPKRTWKEVVESRKKTMKQKYGFENPSQIKEFQEKKKITSLKNWGVISPLSLGSEIRKTIVKTNINKYGGKSPSHSIEVRKKMKETNLRKYGVEYYSQSKKRNFDTSKKILLNDGITLLTIKEFFKKYIVKPWPTKATNVHWFPGQEIINESNMMEKIKVYQSHKTGLEHLFQNLSGLSHFNKKPKKIKRLFRPDFCLNDNVFVNVDGLYWHSEKYHNKHSHKEVRESFEEAQLRILQFRENEVRHNFPIVWSICQNSIGNTKDKIFARKCYIEKISQKEANSFLLKNHLKGSKNAKHFGLKTKDNNVLVSVMSYKIIKNICKIERFCSVINTNIVGGFGKLLKIIETNLPKECTAIHYWVDLRYGIGKFLTNFNFIHKRDTIGWEWTDGYSCFNRLRCVAEKEYSEKENAKRKGIFRIYDSGQRLWEKKLIDESE